MALSYQIIVNDQGTKVIEKHKKEVVDLDDGYKKLSKSMDKTASAADTVGKIMGAGVLVGAVGKFVNAADVEERANKRLENSLRSIGDSYSRVKDEVEKVTKANQDKTRYSDDEQVAVLAELIPLVGSYEKAMSVLPNIMDLASFQQKDLAGAMDDYAQLLNGQVPRGLAKFIPALKDMEKYGSNASAMMMQLVESKTKLSSESDVSSLTSWKNKIDDISEDIGSIFLPAMGGFLDVFKEVPGVLQAVVVIAPVVGIAISTMGGPFTAVAAGVGLLVTGIGYLIRDFKKATKEAQDFKTALDVAASQANSKGLPAPEKNFGYNFGLDKTVTDYNKLTEAEKKAYIAAGGKPPEVKKNSKKEKDPEMEWLKKQGAASLAAVEFNSETKKIIDEGLANSKKSIEDNLSKQQDIEDQFSSMRQQQIEASFTNELDAHNYRYKNLLALAEENHASTLDLEVWHAQESMRISDEMTKREVQNAQIRKINNLMAVGSIIGALGQLNQAMKGNAKITQGILIAETIMNTSAAIMKIMAQGGIFATPLVIAAGIEGAAQIATIASQKFANGGWPVGAGNSRSDNIPVMVSPKERIVSSKEIEAVGGRDAFDRSIRSSMRDGNKKVVQVVLSGPVDRSYLRDVFIPALELETNR